MFQSLTKSLTNIFDGIKSRGVLTEDQIDKAMGDVRIALLEADVALPVVHDFISTVSKRAKGMEVIKSVSPGQMVIKIISDEMVELLSSSEADQTNFNIKKPENLLVVGLQGSGKTTASAKLALKLKNDNKKVLLVSLDTYRPAAQKQLEILATSIDVDSLEIFEGQKPLDIAKRSLEKAKLDNYDVVIYDSAGRLHIDEKMIGEISSIKKIVDPNETLIVVDSMMGQDSIKVAKSFEERVGITSIILSRIDGDSRGGVALSVKYITGKPIKFISNGEKLEDFESFDPKRITSRILDMGDVVSLVEKASSVIEEEEARKAAENFNKGKFNLVDYITQIKMIKKIGGLGQLMKMIPGFSKFSSKLQGDKLNEFMFDIKIAIFNSMTKKERIDPSILNASRKKRIASGSGTTVQQVNALIKEFKKINSIIKKTSKMDPKSLMRNMF